MAKTIYRYSVWVSVPTDEDGEAIGGAMDPIYDAMKKIPGFLESSFEDSYSDED